MPVSNYSGVPKNGTSLISSASSNGSSILGLATPTYGRVTSLSEDLKTLEWIEYETFEGRKVGPSSLSHF